SRPSSPSSSSSRCYSQVPALFGLKVGRDVTQGECFVIRCPGPVRTVSSVASYCASRPALALQGRCCLSGEPEPVIVGLDLGNCSLTFLGAGFPDATGGAIGTPPRSEQPCSSDCLLSRSLPRALECPGGSVAWDLTTTHGDSRTCQGQRNLCNTWLCPENSQCSPDGPGLVQCLCSGSYHGYKCLREGTFPLLSFYGILGAVTTTLSLLAWGSQRRKAKTS
uniref:All-trans retinoic acid induced differentiation factor n=1 Tax=Chrysemys picta bellii TaxID=8478 RepID=A0A8C3FNT4_CHRPI